MAVIAHAKFWHETNTFATRKATWDDFLRPEGFLGLKQGAEIPDVFPPMNLPTGGFITESLALGHTLRPILCCAAQPSAHVTAEAFERIAALLVSGLEAARPFAGVFIELHGAMVTEHLDDGEGELLRRIRAAVGPAVPIVASLDLHSNTTAAMLTHSDGLIAYRTYPHVDMADTGARAARYLDALLCGADRPAKTRRALPFLIPGTAQCTLVEPMKGVYQLLASLENRPGVRHVSFTPGFPFADIYDCGPVVLAYADTQELADATAETLYQYIADREAQFVVSMMTPAEAVAKAIQAHAAKPIVLADVQDNCGGGATSDTTGILSELVRQGAQDAVVALLADPEAAKAAHTVGVGGTVEMGLGGKLFLGGGPPVHATWTVLGLSDGVFAYTGPFLKGCQARLGLTAYLQTGGVAVIVSTNRMQAADQAIFRHIGCDPAAQKILALKSTVHFRADFTDLASQIWLVEAPGALVDRPENLPYRRLRPGVRLYPMGREH